MLEIGDRAVLYSGQIVLTDEEDSFRLKMDNGITLDVRFLVEATQQVSVSPSFSGGVFKIDLINFGNAFGMATSGIILAQTASGNFRDQDGAMRPGAWRLQYALTTHAIGDEKPTRLVNITISEKRIA